MQKKPQRKQWFNTILLSGVAYVSATTAVDAASTPISATVAIDQTLTASSEVPIENNNNDNFVNAKDGTQFIITITSNSGNGVCIEATTNGGLIHANDNTTLTPYQVMCSNILSDSGAPIAFDTFDSNGSSTWLDTSHIFFNQSSNCEIKLDDPLDEMYHGNYSSNLTYNVYPGTC